MMQQAEIYLTKIKNVCLWRVDKHLRFHSDSPSLSTTSLGLSSTRSTVSFVLGMTSGELSANNFGFTAFLSFVEGMLFRNSNSLSSFWFSVRDTLGGVLVPDGGSLDFMRTVGPPVIRKENNKNSSVTTKNNSKKVKELLKLSISMSQCSLRSQTFFRLLLLEATTGNTSASAG